MGPATRSSTVADQVDLDDYDADQLLELLLEVRGEAPVCGPDLRAHPGASHVTSERGYLWQYLHDEVVQEFEVLSRLPTRGQLIKLGCAIKKAPSPVPFVAQPHPLLHRRHYARSIARGQCVKCSQPARLDRKTCAECSRKSTERNRQRRAVDKLWKEI